MARPPYVRWLVVGAIVLIGVALEMSGRATTPHPFLVMDVAAGTAINGDDLEWRDVPVGLLDVPDFEGATAATDLTSGSPLIADMLTHREELPPDWWSVPVALPPGAVVGSEVRLVLTQTGVRVTGRVVASPVDGGFGFEEPGLVAVPAEHVTAVATAAATSDLVVAVRAAR